MNKRLNVLFPLTIIFLLTSCNVNETSSSGSQNATTKDSSSSDTTITLISEDIPTYEESTTEVSQEITKYVDSNNDVAYIPVNFKVSTNESEKVINTGLVVIAPDNSEYVWVPTTKTELTSREFGSYYSGSGSVSNYYDETSDAFNKMVNGTSKYGGFYIGRFETSKGSNNTPKSVRISQSSDGSIWTNFAPQDTQGVCEKLYSDNDTVEGFFPWGCNIDTTLQWLIDSGNKTFEEVARDSTSWGNYSNDTFSINATGNLTGVWEETNSNNIYDLAGNNWEWNQERNGSNYVMRGGGYNLMGGKCEGSRYPAALRDPLPGNNHHPNVTFRIGLYLK